MRTYKSKKLRIRKKHNISTEVRKYLRLGLKKRGKARCTIYSDVTVYHIFKENERFDIYKGWSSDYEPWQCGGNGEPQEFTRFKSNKEYRSHIAFWVAEGFFHAESAIEHLKKIKNNPLEQ